MLELISVSDGGGIISYPLSVDGGYDEYRDMRQKQRDAQSFSDKAASPSSSKQSYLASKEEQAQSRRAKAQRQKNEKRALDLEAQIEDLQQKLFGEAATDYVLATEIQTQIDQAEEELLSVYEALEN